MPTRDDWPSWETQFVQFIQRGAPADVAHDLEHIRRVVTNARMLAAQEQAGLAIVLPAAWLHDCVSVAKDSMLRAQASLLAGPAAIEFLQTISYPAQHLPAIRHAIEQRLPLSNTTGQHDRT
jgi:uncharacterized protein